MLRLHYISLLAIVLNCVLSASAQLAMPDRVCVGAIKSYWVDSTANPGSIYTWAIDDQVVQSTTACAFTYAWTLEGSFGLTLREMSAEGCTGELQAGLVLVAPAPPLVISIGAGTEPACQPTDGNSTTRYFTEAAGGNVTYSAWPADAGSIGSKTGIMNWAVGFSGTVIITATANPCNIIQTTEHKVTISPTVGIPVFFKGSSSIRSRAGESMIYTAIAVNSSDIIYSLDVASLEGGNAINPFTGEVNFTSLWFGTSVITAMAHGCNGPRHGSHVVKVNNKNPVISWNNPADIVYGTPLSDAQLNAAADLPGSFTYSPFAGALLNAGPKQTITAIFTPADSFNYHSENIYVEINVAPRPIVVQATANTKVYDGTAACSGTPAISAVLVNGDTANFIQIYDNKNAGTGKIITPIGKVNSSRGTDNYMATYIPLHSGIIEPRVIPIRITAANKEYDGNTSASILTLASAELIGGDIVYFSGGIAAFDSPSAGTGKTVTSSGFTLTGPDAGNYQSIRIATTRADITPLKVAANLTFNATSFTHLSDLITMTATIEGGAPLAGGSPAASTVTFSCKGNVIKDAGNDSCIVLTETGSSMVASLTLPLFGLIAGPVLSGTREVVAVFNNKSENYSVSPNPAKGSFSFVPEFDIRVFPNPANGPDLNFQLTLSVSSSVTIDLFSSNGQLVSRIFQGYLSGGESRIITCQNNLPQGIYLYQVKTKNLNINGRIIIIREY